MQQDKIHLEMRVRTYEALKNLFAILKIDGPNFDDRLFELASRAFAGASTPINVLRDKAAHGMGTRQRRRIDIKGETYWQLREMHGRMFPYISWVSWDWFLNEIIKALEDTLQVNQSELLLPKE